VGDTETEDRGKEMDREVEEARKGRKREKWRMGKTKEERESEELLTLLMYGAETFLRSCQLCSHSGNSQRF
jgi:hypothetical protein